MASPPPPPSTSNQPFDMQKFFNTQHQQSPSPPPTSSYPPPTGPHPHHFLHPSSQFYPFENPQNAPRFPPHPNTSSPPPPNPGTHLLALINNNNPSPEFSQPPPPPLPGGGIMVSGAPMRLPSSCVKPPTGRVLTGERLSYDIDVRLPNEMQPQLEVNPITKYNSDPQLVIGRQIAVNKVYICYGLKQGHIRVLNINTASRALLRGHTQRVTDMAFFAEDVHLLASVSVEGRVIVWRIADGSDEDDTQITGNTVTAIQIVGEKECVHPRVCWYCHKQEVLVVGIGRRVFKIDTTKVGKGETFTAETPLQCPVDKLIDGVQLIGEHDGEVTDISMCQWMITRLVSASSDGVIKIWDDRKAQPLAVFRPHDGQPVNAAMFLAAPTMPSHIILVTAGALNREVKVWSSASEEGWLLPSDSDCWKCIQTLELNSSGSQVEEAFFNQVVALPQPGFLLLANAKRNAIYVVHIEYGPNPAASHMDYIAEFTVTIPILSFTATSDNTIKVYCFQTQAIQQYTLDLSQCLPPVVENAVAEKLDSSVLLEPKHEGIQSSKPTGLVSAGSAAKTVVQASGLDKISSVQEFLSSNSESKPGTSAPGTSGANIVASPPVPQSPRLARKPSGFRTPTTSLEPGSPLGDHGINQPVIDYSVDRQMDNNHSKLSDASSLNDDMRNDEKKVASDNISRAINPPVIYNHPTHLVTPSEILMSVSSSEAATVSENKIEKEASIHDAAVNNDMGNAEVEVKEVGETRLIQNPEFGRSGESPVHLSDNREKYFCSQASGLGIEMARECSGLSTDYGVEEAHAINGVGGNEQLLKNLGAKEDVRDSTNDMSGHVPELAAPSMVQQPATPGTKIKKQKRKNSHVTVPTSASQSAFGSTDSSHEPGGGSSHSSTEIAAIQETLNQLMAMQKELQKQFSNLVTLPVMKEGKRLEASLGRNIDRAVKANNDALWARFQEENAKNEKLSRDRTQQITNLITNLISKDLTAMLEKAVKRELAAIGPALIRNLAPAIEKTISATIIDSFQRGVGDKAVNQLEKSVNSKLEATVARQIQAQFQTSGKQALQEALRTSVEASVIPAFEISCKAMFDQVDATFQKGISEHTVAALQKFESAHTPLALTLRETVNSASSVVQTLSGELADSQRKLSAAAAAQANQNAVNPLVTQLSNGSLAALHEKVELDPTKELSRLLSDHKYEEAFSVALQRSDLSLVSWLCSQVDLRSLLTRGAVPLSQGILLSLLQQLACDIQKDTSTKLTWMTDVATAIEPKDPVIAMHGRPILEQVSQILLHQRNSGTMSGPEVSSVRLLMHVINSVLSGVGK